MTKLQKVNEFTGILEDVYPNLIIVGGKNIAVPVDKQHLVKNMDAKVRDIIWIKYDERGYLLDAQLKEKGKLVEKKPDEVVHQPQESLPKQEIKPTPIKEYVSLRDRLIILQSNAKLAADVYATTNLTTVQPEDFDSAMDLIWTRAIKDLGTVITAAGGSSL